MADWTNIADSALDPDAPVTSELAYAWRDNPIAIAEGAVGAPRVTASGIKSIAVSQGATDTTPVVFLGLGGLEWITFAYAVTLTSPSSISRLQISTSSNGGSTWSGWFNLETRAAGPGTDNYYGCVNYVRSMETMTQNNTIFVSGGAGINAVRFAMDQPLAGQSFKVAIGYGSVAS